MERVITIKGRTGRYNASSFVWTENEHLTIRFDVKSSVDGKYVISAKHGASEKTIVLPDDKTVEFTPEWLKNGGENPLEIIIEFRTPDLANVIIPSADRNRRNGGFLIEPLSIERIDKQFTAVGYFEIIEDMLSKVNSRIDEINARFARFEEVGVPLRFVEPESEEETETETEIKNEEINGNEELEN